MRINRVAVVLSIVATALGTSLTPAFAVDDTTAPVVKLVTPAANANYTQNSTVKASYSCTDTGGSKLASCVGTFPNGANLPTQTTGEKEFKVWATDGAGNITKVTRTYNVVPAPSVKVTSPNGGQVWTRGVQQVITWETVSLPNNARLKVQVLRGATVVATPAASALPSAGSVNWTPSTSLAKASDYRVKITTVFVSPALTDTSDGPFTLN